MNTYARRSLLLGAAVLAVVGCGRAPRGWIPVLEEMSTSYLDTEVERTLDRVSAARQRVRSDPDGALELLDRAEEGLRSLQDVFLPLLRARSRAYNAYRYHFLGRDGDAARQLGLIEEELLAVSERVNGALLAEIEQIEEHVADARLELQAESPGATDALRELAEEIEQRVARGDLII